MNIIKIRALRATITAEEDKMIQEMQDNLVKLLKKNEEEITDFMENAIKDFAPGFYVQATPDVIRFISKEAADVFDIKHNLGIRTSRMHSKLVKSTLEYVENQGFTVVDFSKGEFSWE
jgi:hypothetical protein